MTGLGYLHARRFVGPGQVLYLRVLPPVPPNFFVRLLNGQNYEKYTRGQTYVYYGPEADEITDDGTDVHFVLEPPHPGFWHLVIDRDGEPVAVNAEVAVAER